jgi:large subunit ribosomal protein L9
MGTVQIILREDVLKLGNAGDLVTVKPGYARNFLVPQGKAMFATAQRVNEVEHQKRVISEKLAKEHGDLKAVKAKLDGVSLEFEAQAGDEGKLFGSITAQHIAEQLGEKGLDIDRRKLVLPESIKSVGEHSIAIKLRGALEARLKVVVTPAE